MTLAGTAIMGFGVSLAVIADMVMNSGEAFIKVVEYFVRRLSRPLTAVLTA